MIKKLRENELVVVCSHTRFMDKPKTITLTFRYCCVQCAESLFVVLMKKTTSDRHAIMGRRLDNCIETWRQLKAGAIKHKRKILVAVCLLLFVQFWSLMLTDVEYAGQDVTVRGLRIFDWLKAFVPGKYKPLTDTTLAPNAVLFVKGISGIRGTDVVQGGVYDCRFLSALASLASSKNGRESIEKMIKSQPDGSFTVTFPGDSTNPVTVGPLTQTEVRLYARAEDRASHSSSGMWVPVIEKAYGRYRIDHMSGIDRVLRLLKHTIFEARLDSAPILVGFGASYGSGDDLAMSLLTDRPTKQLMTWGYEIGTFGLGKGYATVRQVQSWFDRAKTVKSFEDEQHAALVASSKSGGIATAGTELSQDAATVGLRPGHAYALIGYDVDKRVVLISDPMGKIEFRDGESGSVRDGVNDGIFMLSLTDFNRYFSHLTVLTAPG